MYGEEWSRIKNSMLEMGKVPNSGSHSADSAQTASSLALARPSKAMYGCLCLQLLVIAAIVAIVMSVKSNGNEGDNELPGVNTDCVVLDRATGAVRRGITLFGGEVDEEVDGQCYVNRDTGTVSLPLDQCDRFLETGCITLILDDYCKDPTYKWLCTVESLCQLTHEEKGRLAELLGATELECRENRFMSVQIDRRPSADAPAIAHTVERTIVIDADGVVGMISDELRSDEEKASDSYVRLSAAEVTFINPEECSDTAEPADCGDTQALALTVEKGETWTWPCDLTYFWQDHVGVETSAGIVELYCRRDDKNRRLQSYPGCCNSN